jgi:two-component system NtrC family sensor kinase
MNTPLENPDKFDLKGHTILIIEDEPANLGVMSDYLVGFDLEVLTARNGKSGLEKAWYAQPDLILLDVMMPGIDGFETCRQLKQNEASREIPVIFMTALVREEDKVKGFEVGGVDYVTKPIQPAEVLARVTTHLRIRDLTRTLQKQNKELEELTYQLYERNDRLRKLSQEVEKKNARLEKLAAELQALKE